MATFTKEITMRKTCLDCVLKHVAQAQVLLCEVDYPKHRYLAIGHLAEAESECIRYPSLRSLIRELRLGLSDSDETINTFDSVYELIESVYDSLERRD